MAGALDRTDNTPLSAISAFLPLAQEMIYDG
jgi:hypothetical protein